MHECRFILNFRTRTGDMLGNDLLFLMCGRVQSELLAIVFNDSLTRYYRDNCFFSLSLSFPLFLPKRPDST